MATGTTPPLPPDIIQQQQAPPEQQQSVFSAQGVNQPQDGMQVVQQVMGQIQKLDQWVGETKTLLESFDPSLVPLFKPIAEAGMKLAEEIQKKAQRSGMAKGSPVVPPQPPSNPSAGPPSPVM
jgi:hypothetical protein